jgi:hypothetical protein
VEVDFASPAPVMSGTHWCGLLQYHHDWRERGLSDHSALEADFPRLSPRGSLARAQTAQSRSRAARIGSPSPGRLLNSLNKSELKGERTWRWY